MSKLVKTMESNRNLQKFGSEHPELLSLCINDLKKARVLVYRTLERLNFPDKFTGSGNLPLVEPEENETPDD